MSRSFAKKSQKDASEKDGRLPPEPTTKTPDPRKTLRDLQQAAGNQAVSEQFGSPSTEHVPPALDTEGQPLDGTTRARMEARLGKDLSEVRIHKDAEAAKSARQLKARAYTLGQDIVFGAGNYAPDTAKGQQLLAHELIHTIQAKHRTIPAQQEAVSTPTNGAEREASTGAAAAITGQAVQISQGACPATIYRSVVAELLDSLEGGLWIKGPYADIAIDMLNELTGYEFYLDSDGKVFVDPTKPRNQRNSSTTAATLILEIVNNANIRVVVNAVDHISAGLIGAFDTPAGTGQQQIDVPDMEAANQPPGIHGGAALFHEISEAYFGRIIEREPGMLPLGERVYNVAHPMALEAENRVRSELGLPAREQDEFPLLQLPQSVTGSSIPYAVSIDVFATHFQINLLAQDPASGNITFEQTFVIERHIQNIDWDRDWQGIINQVSSRFRFRP